MNPQLNIFAIYTSTDENTMLRLMRHLQPLNELHEISIWHDNPIHLGQPWKPLIKSRLHDADVFLFLVSDTFMHSEFIGQLEFKNIIDRYKDGTAGVIPILVDQCPWDIDFNSDDYDFSFKELQVLPELGKPISDYNPSEQAFDKITAALGALLKSMGSSHTQAESEIIIEDIPAIEITEAQSELNFTEDWEANKTAEESKHALEEAEALRKLEEEKRLLEEAEATRIAEEERKHLEQVERQIIAEQERELREEAHREQVAIETQNNSEDIAQTKNTNPKKRILVGSLIAALALFGIWTFSTFNKGPEKKLAPTPEEDTMYARDSSALSTTEIEPVEVEESLPELVIGDRYEGGIIFSMDPSGKTGKIAHIDDAGPMPWQDANIIHDQLGAGWRLPTLDELKMMRQTIGQGADNSGEFSNGLYWSATLYEEHQARLLKFSNGNASYHYNKSVEERKFKVRAVHDFNR